MISTTGTWSADQRHIYFLSTKPTDAVKVQGDHILVAVNEIRSEQNLAKVEAVIDAGKHVLIDSGIFWLTNQHARQHNVSMDDALALSPDDIDGFDWLWKRYIEIAQRLGDRAWGYVELDQGGLVNKRITRAKLEDLGLNPMPVYHPLHDGRDYFDELAESYDRLCVGNFGMSSSAQRLRLLHALWDQHRRYPDLWVHALGVTPNQLMNAFPVDSCDSSGWMRAVRWSGYQEQAMLAFFSEMPNQWLHKLQDHDSYDLGVLHGSNGVLFGVDGLRHWLDELNDVLGLPPYPALHQKETS